MKKLFLLLLIIFLFSSCGISEKTVSELLCKPYDYENYICRMTIPKGYKRGYSYAEINKEYYYYYPNDSSWLYISNAISFAPMNSHNVETMGDSIFKFRYQYKPLWEDINRALGEEVMKIIPDTLELSGIDADSLYWKDVYLDGISIGYLKVPKEKKELYDKCLGTFKMEKKVDSYRNRKSP